MNWFQHDSDSLQDAKIKKLIIKCGAIGYAVYFHCLELIAADVSETNLTFELEHDAEIIADDLRIPGTGEKSGREIVESIMMVIIDLGLFKESEGHIFCFKLLKRINLSQTSSPKFRAMITEAKTAHHDEIMTHHDDIMINHDKSCYQPTNNTNNTNQEREERASAPKDNFSLSQKSEDPDYDPELDPELSSAPPPNPRGSTNDGATRIEKSREAWNKSGAGPTCRFLAITFPPQDLTDCLRTVSAYSEAEIVKAIENYAKIRASPEHEIFSPYGSFVGFMRRGVEKFVDESNPWEVFRIDKASGSFELSPELQAIRDRERELEKQEALA
jgi:hypothetical protein